MEIKIQCGCGTKYKFEVEPVNGRMPARVQCPNCGNDGTTDANQIIADKLPYAVPPPGALRPSDFSPSLASAPSLRVASSASYGSAPGIGLADPEPTAGARHQGSALLARTTFFIKERVAVLKLNHVFDHANQQVVELKGDWKGWNFRALNKSGREPGTVTKEWAGLGRELFTSADNTSLR
jgi:hypothetical protein